MLRGDIKDIADYDQVGRALRELVQEGLLIKIGYGLYARARINRITGNVMADNPSGSDCVVIEAMEKLGVEYQLDDLSRMNLSGDSLSTQFDSSLFADVADTLGLGNPAIVEKDYYVVQLLTLIDKVSTPYHQIIFSGGTALAKSSIKTHRMSKDVDLKIVPNDVFHTLTSRSDKKKARKAIRLSVEEVFDESPMLKQPEDRMIGSIYAKVLKEPSEIK
jgi:hypothetical protein